MQSLRHSIGGAMAAVAVVALNIAIARAASISSPELLIGGALPCIALQWAAYSLLRRRGRARAFWLGFTALGSILTASFIWAMLSPGEIGITRDGARLETPGSALYAIWMGYGQFVSERIGPLLFDFSAQPGPFSPALIAFRAVLWSLPQLFLASVGGLIAWGILGSVGSKTRPGSLGGPPNPALQRTRPAAAASGRATVSLGGPVR